MEKISSKTLIYMKKNNLISLFLMLLSFSGCGDLFSNSTNNEEPKLEVGTDFISECGISSNGAVFSFSFDANGEWNISSKEDWITISPASGNGPASVEVTVAPYEDLAAKNIRSAWVDLSMDYLFERIKVSQLPIKPTLDFSLGTDLTPKVSSKGGTFSFSFDTNKEWRAVGFLPNQLNHSCDWITVSPTSGKGPATIEVTVAPNNTVGPRVHSVILEVCAGQNQACECTKAITITQDSEQPVPDNVIYYTSSSDAVVRLTYAVDFTGSKPQDTFGAKEVTNTYRNGLGTITFDGPVTRIPNKALTSEKMKSIIIPNCVTSIGEGAFSGSGITSFVVPDSVTEIGTSAFAGTRLQDISIPDNIETIGNWFTGTFLWAFNFLDGVSNIEENAFYNCQTNYAYVTIPEGVTSISKRMFSVAYFAYIELPKSVKEIKEYAFAYSRLKSITIHDNITSIENNAFDDCSDLESVFFESMTPPTFGDNVFGRTSPPIYVPAAALNAYKSSPGLEKYQDRIMAYFGE